MRNCHMDQASLGFGEVWSMEKGEESDVKEGTRRLWRVAAPL